ncbi:MAG: deoxyribodipyrimidine photo-lyase, partial [Pseudomonadota bacterium]
MKTKKSNKNKQFKRSLFWFRRDLRLQDNVGLAHALGESQEVIPLFVFDPLILPGLLHQNHRAAFIHQSLQEIQSQLRQWKSYLIVVHDDPRKIIPKLAKEWCVQAVYTNRDYEPYAKERDGEVRKALEKNNISFLAYKDQVLFESGEVVKKDGGNFVVYSPYARAWRQKIEEDPVVLGKFILQNSFFCQDRQLFGKFPFPSPLPLKAGEKTAQNSWKKFKKTIGQYHKNRDYPSLDATSGLSTPLRFGTISIRQLVRETLLLESPGARCWLGELIWREFFSQILDNFPHVVDHPFRTRYEKISWPGKREHLLAWQEGRTGFPLIDAAMRHFARSGMMHNRLRMVVASFLVKTLLIDWRLGEEYFAHTLMDYDLASNNGNWQWCASTGCDAQPYFRIFNPVAQSQKYDANGDFIRLYCPELKNFSA